MSPNMQRSKLLAVAVATLVGLAAGVVFFTGGAAAAQWHDYEGDIHPGHAYALEVPEKADAIEIAFAGAETGAARLAVFDPSGAIVSYYTLGASPAAATIVQPDAGRYVLYVYDVTDGALSLRVSAEEKPALELQKIPLAREDVVLTSAEAPQALDQVLTAKLEGTPVFVTLLYEGSVKDLDAAVASTKGTVVTITDETATAFSPGVWASQTGERASDFSNLAAGAYTVTAKAEKFEGTLVLTALALDLDAAPPVEDIELPPVVPPVTPGDLALFAIAAREPLAVQLDEGTLVLADGDYLADQAEAAPAASSDEEDEEENETDEHRHAERAQHYATSLVLVFTPDDAVLAQVQLDSENPIASVEIPEAGEYVLFVTYTGAEEGLFGKLDGALVAPETRALPTEELVHEFETTSFLGASDEIEFELERVPVEMFLFNSGGLGAFESAYVENENGIVASTETLMTLGPGGIWMGGFQDPLLFAAGTHTLRTDSLVSSGGYTLYTLHYVREVVEETPAEDEHAHDEAHDAHAEQSEESEEPEQGEDVEEEEPEGNGLPLPMPFPVPKRLPF